MISPLSSWVIVADVEVNTAVHPLLQKSAVDISERLRDLSEKIGTEIENLGLDRIPAASDIMVLPLGSPTPMVSSEQILLRNCESESLKIVLVAPQSCIGVVELAKFNVDL